MDHLVEAHSAQECVEGGASRDVAGHEGEWLLQLRHGLEVAPLDGRVVEVVQVIQSPDGVTEVQQSFTHVRPDESGAAGDQEIHAGRVMEGGRV
jgi:hypothetical protein